MKTKVVHRRVKGDSLNFDIFYLYRKLQPFFLRSVNYYILSDNGVSFGNIPKTKRSKTGSKDLKSKKDRNVRQNACHVNSITISDSSRRGNIFL